MPTKYERNQPLPSVGWSRSATLLVAYCLALAAQAQTAWPSKPVKLVVAFPPGGVADVMARVVSQPLSEALGQPVIIENKGGAGGNVAAVELARTGGDGHSFMVNVSTLESVNPVMFERMPVNPAKDFQHVALLANTQLFLVTRPTLPVTDVKSLVAYAKANPGKLSYASAGAGTTPNVGGELFKQGAGIFATHIPYRGAAPAIQDLMAGQVDFGFMPGTMFQHVKAGKLKLLGVASRQRTPNYPSAPTITEETTKRTSLTRSTSTPRAKASSSPVMIRFNSWRR